MVPAQWPTATTKPPYLSRGPCVDTLSDARGLGSPAVPVWLIAPCSFEGLGVLPPAPTGASTSDGDMRLIARS